MKDNIFNVCETKNIDDAVEKLFIHFRQNGFPHYDLNQYDANNELSKLKSENGDVGK